MTKPEAEAPAMAVVQAVGGGGDVRAFKFTAFTWRGVLSL